MSISSAIHKKTIFKYKQRIEDLLPQYIEEMGPKNKLRDACAYALLNGGKRLRPIIVQMVAKALGNGYDVIPVAMGMEFMHTASLIADDMPSMDDEEYRREAEALHKKFGDDLALLASYSLIAEGYRSLYKNRNILIQQGLKSCKANEICAIALENTTACTGLNGACGGQFLDIYPAAIDLKFIEEVIYKKTGTLFEVAFMLGWLYGGGDASKVDLVKKCAYHFGLAFQIQDDILDHKEDLEKDKKINMAVAFGVKTATERYHLEVENSIQTLKALDIYSKDFIALVGIINNRMI